METIGEWTRLSSSFPRLVLVAPCQGGWFSIPFIWPSSCVSVLVCLVSFLLCISKTFFKRLPIRFVSSPFPSLLISFLFLSFDPSLHTDPHQLQKVALTTHQSQRCTVEAFHPSPTLTSSQGFARMRSIDVSIGVKREVRRLGAVGPGRPVSEFTRSHARECLGAPPFT
jgi:hypothetical protein